MSWLRDFFSKTNFSVSNLNPCLKLDFGSSQTRMMLGQEVVWHQPTLLLWHHASQSVSAVGDQAANLRGKLPSSLQLISPIQQGVVVDLEFAKLYLQAVLVKLREQKKIRPWLPLSGEIALAASCSPLEIEQFKSVLEQAGLRVKQISSKSQAVVALPEFQRLQLAHGIIDCGAQTTEIGIFVGQKIIKATTLTTCRGDDFTDAVQKQVLKEYGLEIGWAMAEQIKFQLGSVLALAEKENKNKTGVMTVRGKEVKTQQIITTRINAGSFQARFAQLAGVLVAQLQEVLATLPTEIVTQLQEQGLCLVGGGSQLGDLQFVLQKILKMPVIISKSPQLAVVEGLSSAK